MKRFISMIKKLVYYLILPLCVWMMLAQCLIMKERWSDKKAYKVFKSKNVPLLIYDTLINESHLHYAVSGYDTLPTLVFIHGSPGTWVHYMKYMWDSSLQKKFRMVAIDRPGFGYSSFGKAMHLQQQSNMILPVLQKLKNNKPMYAMGHSMGGPVLVKMAADAPLLFHTIIIAAGAIDASQEKKEVWRKIMNVKPLYWALPGAFGPSNKELLYLKKDLVELQKDFEKITCQVIFVHGDKDTWVPIENIQYSTKMMTHAAAITADTLHGAGHQIPWKNKEAITAILQQLY